MIERNSIDVDAASDAFERFIAKVDDEPDPTEACWEWTAGTFPDGYGRFTLDGHRHVAHRITWALAYGRDPSDHLVLHECDNPVCVNVLHLYLGGQSDNMRDAMERGRLETPYWTAKGEENPGAKLTASEVREIRARAMTGAVTQADLADEYGVSAQTISAIVRGEAWTHVGGR